MTEMLAPAPRCPAHERHVLPRVRLGQDLVGHLHVMKCGGTSLDAFLVRELNETATLRCRESRRWPFTWLLLPQSQCHAAAKPSDQRLAASCIGCFQHADWSWMMARAAKAKVSVLAWLRDPVERAVSNVNYHRRIGALLKLGVPPAAFNLSAVEMILAGLAAPAWRDGTFVDSFAGAVAAGSVTPFDLLSAESRAGSGSGAQEAPALRLTRALKHASSAAWVGLLSQVIAS